MVAVVDPSSATPRADGRFGTWFALMIKPTVLLAKLIGVYGILRLLPTVAGS
jgi:hypothetical protein